MLVVKGNRGNLKFDIKVSLLNYPDTVWGKYLLTSMTILLYFMLI